jgi:hypothetical protein
MSLSSQNIHLWPNYSYSTTEHAYVDKCPINNNFGRLTVMSKSKSHYDRRPVSQYVLVSSPIWDFWPQIFFSFSISKLRSCLCGTPSLTRGRVCLLSVLVNTVYSSQSVITLSIYILCHTHFSDLQYVQATFSPGFVQQIMPYLLVLSLPRQS